MQVFRISLLAAAILVAGVGCQNTYHQTTTDVAPASPLNASSRVYIAMPEDAVDKKEVVAGSGKRTSIALFTAFQKHAKNVQTGKIPETLPDAIAHARDLGYEYVAFTSILKWQDRPTEWTGVRDKLDLKIDLISVESGQVVRTTSIDAKSRWMTEGDDAPQDLLAEPVDKFVRSLFRMTYTPTALDSPR